MNPLSLSSDVHSYPLGDELILFAEGTGRLIRANPIAALIWQASRDGLAPDDIAALLAEAFELPLARAVRDVTAICDDWQALGLLSTSPRFSPVGDAPVSTAPGVLVEADDLPPRGSESLALRYRLLDSRVSLRVPDAQVAQLIHPMLAHLATEGEETANLDLEVRRASDRYLLLRDGVPIDACGGEPGLRPMVHANLLMLAYDQSAGLMGVHAAAVQSDACCLLMPALSRSGKTTLAAALVGSGFNYCADDLVLLTESPVRMRPAPVAMGIKQGAWGVLADYHPGLSALPVGVRADQQRIRYLAPAPGRLADTSVPLTTTHLVFPRYSAGSAARLIPISAAAGLCRLTEAGYDVQGQLTPAIVDQLVNWIAAIPCYEFRYDSLPAAVTLLRTLCA